MTQYNQNKPTDTTKIEFCLYARKSSESDERQTMSIGSQIDEMKELAKRDGIKIKEIKQESHSAKMSGSRPVFMELLQQIRQNKFNGILTWAPDRLSRNAGDLGSLVDLMDQGRLVKIQTYSQSFTNSPNEKFLLMILCSQAKLENDNKGLNVKRGLKTKCTMGWRPSVAPTGYLNQPGDGYKDELIIPDSDRANFVTAMFERVAYQGHSGRAIKHWLDRIGFKSRNDKQMPLSKIYSALRNPFYYGEFEFPKGSGNWYKGKHKPLITKELFDKVQEILEVPPRGHKSRIFPFKSIFTCGKCGSKVTAEEKFRKLKFGGYTKHIYYHCTRSANYECDEPYITEDDLIKQLIANIDKIKFNQAGISRKIQEDIEKYHRLKTQVLDQEYLDGRLPDYENFSPKTDNYHQMTKNYLLHILKVGTSEERQEAMLFIKTKFILTNKTIAIQNRL
ncbi:MAG: recombinase family protein [Candidatus Shapirobacteria bacterium]|nr:recombinase family protein [Candidatus Shapirobacteria bacterium]